MSPALRVALCCCFAAWQLVEAVSQLSVSADGHLMRKQADLEPATSVKTIPRQLVMTGKEASIEELPSKMRSNVKQMLALNPDLKTRYLSDTMCRMYMRQHFDDELADMYIAEKAGHFRGDICRAAVLYNEGGFYADLDLQPRLPFSSMVDSSTKFMSVFTADGAILNALMAVVPASPVMEQTLAEVKQWYKGDQTSQNEGQWMGTVTLKRALLSVMKKDCKSVDLETQRQNPDTQWKCGPHEFRFYRESKLDCGRRRRATECPKERKLSKFVGLRYGIFTPGESRELIAWPRTVECDSWWCGGR